VTREQKVQVVQDGLYFLIVAVGWWGMTEIGKLSKGKKSFFDRFK
jgi:hypothetical protein